FMKMAREHSFNSADWNHIRRYRQVKLPMTNCKYVFRLSICDMNAIDKDTRNGELGDLLSRDRTMVEMWDIETWRKIQNGQPPTPEDDDYVIFMICQAFFWQYSDVPL